MEGYEDNYNNDELEVGTYCYVDDEDDAFCIIESQDKKSNKYQIIDFQENREREVVASSLQRIHSTQDLELARQSHEKYLKSTNIDKASAEIQESESSAETNMCSECLECLECTDCREACTSNTPACLLWILIPCIGLGLILLFAGFIIHDSVSEFAKNGSAETCYLTGYYIVECQYNCNCDIQNQCNRCDGESIGFTATTEEKCKG